MISADGSGIGQPQFFIGVVENNVDESREGKIQVRAFGIHGSHSDIKTKDLPWAICASGNYDPNNPPPPLNAFVYGMFLDGRMAQHPLILGLIPGKYNEAMDPIQDGYGVIAEKDGDLLGGTYAPRQFNAGGGPDKLATSEKLLETYLLAMAANRVHDQKIANTDETWSEPPPAYAAKYPYNKVIKTSRHSIEIDDSPGAERIMIHHNAGSYIQIDAKGSVTERAEADRYEVNIGTKHESSGHSVVTINGNAHVYVKGNKTEEIEGDYRMLVHGNAEFGVGGQMNLNGGEQVQLRGGDVKLEANAGIMTVFGKKEIQLESTNQLNFVAKNIKNTALNTYDVFSTKAIKLSTPGDIHLLASNIINTATGLIPPTPMTGTTGTIAQVGWSLTAPSMIIAAANGSFSGIWNAGVVNAGALTATTANATTLNAGAINAAGVNTQNLAAPLPISSAPGSPCAPNAEDLDSIRAVALPTAPTIPTLPIIQIPLISNPIAAPLPGITSGWAYPTGNSPEFITKVLNPVNAFAAIIADFLPIGLGAWGMTQAKMPEPPGKSTSIVPKGYFAMGYSAGVLSPLDDSATNSDIGGL